MPSARSRATASCTSLGFCLNFCQYDSECSDGRVCDPYITLCVYPEDLLRDGLGSWAPCLRNEECLSQVCGSGRCFTNCSVERQGCPGNEVCVDLFDADLGWCFAPCHSDAECLEDNTKCLIPFGIASAGTVCAPPHFRL